MTSKLTGANFELYNPRHRKDFEYFGAMAGALFAARRDTPAHYDAMVTEFVRHLSLDGEAHTDNGNLVTLLEIGLAQIVEAENAAKAAKLAKASAGKKPRPKLGRDGGGDEAYLDPEEQAELDRKKKAAAASAQDDGGDDMQAEVLTTEDMDKLAAAAKREAEEEYARLKAERERDEKIRRDNEEVQAQLRAKQEEIRKTRAAEAAAQLEGLTAFKRDDDEFLMGMGGKGKKGGKGGKK